MSRRPCGQIARSLGAGVIEWQGDRANGWAPDLDHLVRALTPRTRVVVVNSPHNPTGFHASAAFMHALSELSERHGFVVFSDEVYRGLELDPADRLHAFADLNECAVSLGVMSKTYGLAGLRIGWLASAMPNCCGSWPRSRTTRPSATARLEKSWASPPYEQPTGSWLETWASSAPPP